MKAYKGTDNFKCIEMTYEVGKTYTFKGELSLCEQGFHFCKKPDDIFNYYPYDKDFVLLEIEILGRVIDDYDKSVTDKFKVLREVPKSEYNNIFKEYKFDKNDNIVYEENSIGYWKKFEYDENNNLIYYEDSSGSWKKWEYDKNNNQIYYEISFGYWKKFEYDENNNQIYYEDSNGCWRKWKYNDKGNEIYYENSFGYWCKTIYDENNNLIKLDNSDNHIIIYTYNEKNQCIKDVCLWNDFVTDYEYDENGNEIYVHNSDGEWCRKKYDDKNNMIYHETDDAGYYSILIED